MPNWFHSNKSLSPTATSRRKKSLDGILTKLKLKNLNRDDRRFSLDSDGSGNGSESRSPTTPYPLPSSVPSSLSPTGLLSKPSLPLPSPTNPPPDTRVDDGDFDFGSGSTSSTGSQESSSSGPTKASYEFPRVDVSTDANVQGFHMSAFGNVNGGLSSRHIGVHDLGQVASPPVSQRFSNTPFRTYSGNNLEATEKNCLTGSLESPAPSPRPKYHTDPVLGNTLRAPKSLEPSLAPSPIGRSPIPSPRLQSTAVSPLHPRANVSGLQESFRRENEAHPLPLPPSSTNLTHLPINSPYTAVCRSPERLVSLQTGWRKGALLGSGTFGHVYTGFHSESGQSCAMKEVLIIQDSEKSVESANQLKQEVSMLSQLKHPNIVRYYGCEMSDDRLFIYLEFMSNGSIHNILQQYGPLSESCTRAYTRQMLLGLCYLHGRNIVHRDIKGANILVDKGGEVKLADFGMAKHISEHSFLLSFKGSPYWMAPEVVQNKNGYSFAVDVWSLGCTVLEMATGKPPWSQFEGIAAVFKIGNSKEIPHIPENLSEDTKSFLRCCLQRNPMRRPTAAQLLEQPFVRLQRQDSGVSEVLTSAVQKLKVMDNVGMSGTCSRAAMNLNPHAQPRPVMEESNSPRFTLSPRATRLFNPFSSDLDRIETAPRAHKFTLTKFTNDGQLEGSMRGDVRQGGPSRTPGSSPRRRSCSVWDEACLNFAHPDDAQFPARGRPDRL